MRLIYFIVDQYGFISGWLCCFGGRLDDDQFIMLISRWQAVFSPLCNALFHLSPSLFTVSTSWHTEEDSYRAAPIDRSILPTAPRSAREPKIDRSRLPRSPPYTAFLGNLPYDVTEDSIKDFFRGLAVGLASKHTRTRTGRSGCSTFVQPLQLVHTLKNKEFRFCFFITSVALLNWTGSSPIGPILFYFNLFLARTVLRIASVYGSQGY